MGRRKEYKVTLTKTEQEYLVNLVSTGVESARKLARARILLRANEDWSDREIAHALDVGEATVARVRHRFSEGGLTCALNRKPPEREYERKVDGQVEAHLVALVCGPAPAGYAKWSVRLLADRLVQMEAVELDTISHETVRQILKKTSLSHGRNKNG
jgi:transposase